jgi:hypothetical protein
MAGAVGNAGTSCTMSPPARISRLARIVIHRPGNGLTLIDRLEQSETMNKRSVQTTDRADSERDALRRRVRQFYVSFNDEDWESCYSLIDPKLAEEGKVKLDAYAELMRAFKNAYGSVKLWHTRLSLHLDAVAKQSDKRPFAYVYLIWQDNSHGFHMFRERWIKDNGRWFTRVVGLVPNRQEAAGNRG